MSYKLEPTIWSHDTVLAVVVVVAVVVRTRPRAIPLAIITMRKFIDGFPFLSHMSMGLRLGTLRAAGAPTLGTFRLDYEYEIEYECEFRISNQ